jgi:ABC-type multidrug transport system ATPase subunit
MDERSDGRATAPALLLDNVVKTYGPVRAVDGVSLKADPGEFIALLGPNGAGKTTLINIVCGIVTASTGSVTADGHDIVRDFRAARAKIGLVPQELTTDLFETVWGTVRFRPGISRYSARIVGQRRTGFRAASQAVFTISTSSRLDDQQPPCPHVEARLRSS